MKREERELSITYLEKMKEDYIEGEGYERHPLPEYYAIECAIKALDQESVLDKIRAEIDEARFVDKNTKLCKNANASGLEIAMQIIDKYNYTSI